MQSRAARISASCRTENRPTNHSDRFSPVDLERYRQPQRSVPLQSLNAILPCLTRPLTQAKRWRRAYSCLALVRRLAFAPDNCRSYTCDLSCALASQWVFLNLCTAFRSPKRSCVICARSPTRNLNIFSQLCYALLRSSPQHAVTLGVWLVSRPSTVLEHTALWSVAGKPPKYPCVSTGVKTRCFRTVRNLLLCL